MKKTIHAGIVEGKTPEEAMEKAREVIVTALANGFYEHNGNEYIISEVKAEMTYKVKITFTSYKQAQQDYDPDRDGVPF